MIRFISLFIFCVLLSVSNAQDSFPPVLPTHQINFLSKEDQVEIGDRIQFEVILPENMRGTLSNFRVVNPEEDNDFFVSETPDPSSKGFRFRVAPKKSGELTLRSLKFQDDQGKVYFETEPKSIRVQELKEKSSETKEPETLGLVIPQIPVRVWILLGLVFICIVGFSYFIFQRMKQRKKPTSTLNESLPPSLSAEQIAYRELTKCFQLHPYQEGQIYKELCFKVTEILKEFLKTERALDCDDLTSREWLASLDQNTLLIRRGRDALQDLLTLMDPQKFIDEDHAPKLSLEDYESIRKLSQACIEAWRKPL